MQIAFKVFLLFSLFIIDMYDNSFFKFRLFLSMKKSRLVIFWFAHVCSTCWISFFCPFNVLWRSLCLQHDNLSLCQILILYCAFASTCRVHYFWPCWMNFFRKCKFCILNQAVLLIRMMNCWLILRIIHECWSSSLLFLHEKLSLFLFALFRWSLINLAFLNNLLFLRNLESSHYRFTSIWQLIWRSGSSGIFLHRIWEGTRLQCSSGF